LSGMAASHQFEGTMDTAPIAVALYEHSDVGREWYDLITNYLIGVTNNFGPDEAWNEGPGYGNSKMKWLMNASWYFETAIPGANLGRNPYYRAIGDFFSRVTPVGLPHSPWGNGAANQGYQRGGRVANFRKLAHLTGEGRFMTNWRESGGGEFAKFRPWIEYVLPYYADEPEGSVQEDPVKLFSTAGWVTANSGPPSVKQTFEDGVGVIFQSRPRGGYSHSFNSDNSFQIHAYGQQINHGAGSSTNRDAFAYHTMSHTTILVDGLGQAQPPGGQAVPWYSRVIGFEEGDGYVYFAGDSTAAYPHAPGRFSRWSLPLHPIYEERDCRHLERFVRHVLFVDSRYVVVFDDLKASRPTRFTWLYHILPADPFSFDPETFTARYAVDDVNVVVSHIANRGVLELDDRRDLDAMINPFTGEDYRKYQQKGPVAAHNLWVTNTEPREDMHFLAVIYPYEGEEPEIARLDEFTVRVGEDIVTFDPSVAQRHNADYVIDTIALDQ
ncbi:MAG TPA: heparinase II/III family protein, partial [Armatimonadota bacterium]|nr:heparinase II/III family protein [Armatimonadota bacterium]